VIAHFQSVQVPNPVFCTLKRAIIENVKLLFFVRKKCNLEISVVDPMDPDHLLDPDPYLGFLIWIPDLDPDLDPTWYEKMRKIKIRT